MLGHMIAPEARLIGRLHAADPLLESRRHGAVRHFNVIENTEFHFSAPDAAPLRIMLAQPLP